MELKQAQSVSQAQVQQLIATKFSQLKAEQNKQNEQNEQMISPMHFFGDSNWFKKYT